MGDIPNNTYLDTPVTPMSSIQEPTKGFQSLIPDFTLIIVSCPDSTQLTPMIFLDLNQSQEIPSGTGGTRVYFPKSSPTYNCVIEEIILGYDSNKSIKTTNSIWETINSDYNEESYMSVKNFFFFRIPLF